jgi:hypothetical protein
MKKLAVGYYFRGYTPAEISAYCRVTRDTAKELIAGRAKPSHRILYLFQLHAKGRVLPDHWRDWHFGPKGHLIYDNGVSFMPGELLAIEFLLQNGDRRLELLPDRADNDDNFALEG